VTPTQCHNNCPGRRLLPTISFISETRVTGLAPVVVVVVAVSAGIRPLATRGRAVVRGLMGLSSVPVGAARLLTGSDRQLTHLF